MKVICEDTLKGGSFVCGAFCGKTPPFFTFLGGNCFHSQDKVGVTLTRLILAHAGAFV